MLCLLVALAGAGMNLFDGLDNLIVVPNLSQL